jgi:hypothetical protein
MKKTAMIATIGTTLLWSSLAFSNWWFSVVDYAKSGWGNSIALDSSGSPHIAYTDHKGSDYHFEYVSWNPDDSTWTLEFTGNNSSQPLLELDSRQLPHILTSYATTGYYTYRDTAGLWEVESYMPWYCTYSLAIDSRDQPHVVEDQVGPYYVDTLLNHWHKDSAGWHEEIVYGMLGSANKRSMPMAMDDDDVIHVAYYSGGQERAMCYAKKVNNVWYREVIDTETTEPWVPYRYTSLALDTCGYPCVSYIDGYYTLKFARRDSTGWTVGIADEAPGCSKSVQSLCMGPDNYPRVACVEDLRGVKYVWFDGDHWNVTLLDTTAKWAGVDMVVDKWGQSHVCWDGNGRQNYAKGHGFLGIEEGSNCQLAMGNRQLSAYPNPFTHNAVVEFGVRGSEFVDGEPSTLHIYDMSGRLVESTKSKLIGRNLSPGVYFVKAKGYDVAKIVKIQEVR